MSYTLKLSQDHDDRRLDRTIRSLWKWVTLGEIMKAIRKGEVRINGTRVRECGAHVHAGDELCVPWPLKDDGRVTPHSSWGKIKVIHQGKNVLILNKPSGILVQPDEAGGDSIISRVWGVLGTKTPAAVHRLDRNTTGVLAVALHGDALRALEALFKARTVRKFYMAVVVGTVPPEITIDAPLLKDSENNKVTVSEAGQPAKTLCTRLSSDGKFSLVRLELLTGRTHQARVHMAHIKHPILGDRKYGDFRVNRAMKEINRPLLHAYELEFPDDLHSSLTEIAGKTFRAELPDDMKEFIGARRLHYEG
ncbi:MAG: RluA family pseudouridine synthase [Synergistaceae bacterium]|nr:RluA family pseudouridine synthase [Synergistaceae bacterium]